MTNLPGRDSIPPERWIGNLIEAASNIANKERQEARWLAPNRQAWESPDELICSLLDDSQLELFLQVNESSFTPDQRRTGKAFLDAINSFCESTPKHLNPQEVLQNPQWWMIRDKAEAFALAFRNKWP